jgi:putative ABC transport system permease protein
MNAIYQLALHLLPAGVRERHGEQMAAVFAESMRDVRRRRGRRGACRLLVAELAALVAFAWRERRGQSTPRRIDERWFAWQLQEQGGTTMFGSFVQDLRYAARMLRRTPGFTCVCIATMALAIGANTAIFSVINGVVLKALPFNDPDRLVVLGQHTNGNAALDSITPGNLYDLMKAATAFESVAGFAPTERILTWNGSAERIRGGVSVGSVFDVLGRAPAEGRALSQADDAPGAPAVIVLSNGLARRLFGTQSPVGQSIAVNNVPHAIVGVMPADFAFFDYDYEYWVPARFDAAFRNNRDQYFLVGIARLRAGVTIAGAEAQLNTVMDAIRRDYPQFTQNATAAVAPMKDTLLDGVRTRLLIVMGAVLFVLLIACANIGNLLMARASVRRQELAVRHALGARTGRLIRQMLTESTLLGVLGGLAGVALGAALLRVLLTTLPDNLPRLQGVALDATVLLFTAGISLVSGLIFGVAPALQLTRRTVTASLREGARSTMSGRRVRTALVASEVALALMLLVGAGLLVRSFANLREVPPGFQTDRLLTFAVSVPTTIYRTSPERLAFFERAAADLEAVPGVHGVTMSTTLPVTGRGNGAWFNLIARPLPPTETPPGVPNRVVRANYFQALGIPLLRGRYFTADDRLQGTHAVIISESVARRFWPNEEALGQRIYMGAPDNRVIPESEIVGIVADVKQTGLDEARSEAVYVPHGLVPSQANFAFAVRTSTDPTAIAPSVRRIVQRATAPARSSAVLVGLFAAVAVVLSVIGVFGVLSYTVTQQTTELGIRMALGASARSVRLLVLRQGLAPVAAGVIAGMAGAALLSRAVESQLFGITPTDPWTFALTTALFAVVAVAASSVPARRATRVDPVRILRQE